ncbi:MAG: GNAT family N-acetyltransferase [Aristaeellaceae bacterium]
MTNQDIWQTALRQSAVDCNCRAEDFFRAEPVITLSRAHPKARKYLPLPLACDLTYYGGSVVAQVSSELREPVERYLRRFEPAHCFETPNLHVLAESLAPYGLKVCFMAEYFLPDAEKVQPLPCAYGLRLMTDFAGLYTEPWRNALTGQSPERDVLGVGAWDGEKLIGLAACSADCDTMWQIGVDVLPGYRHQGVAAALVSRLALEVLDRGIVPFYCAAWSNIPSVRCAIRSGFRPGWVELTARDAAFVAGMNQE